MEVCRKITYIYIYIYRYMVHFGARLDDQIQKLSSKDSEGSSRNSSLKSSAPPLGVWRAEDLIPSGDVKIAFELEMIIYSGFSHYKWWFSTAMLGYVSHYHRVRSHFTRAGCTEPKWNHECFTKTCSHDVSGDFHLKWHAKDKPIWHIISYTSNTWYMNYIFIIYIWYILIYMIYLM